MKNQTSTVATATIAEVDASLVVLSNSFPNIERNVVKGIAAN